MWLSSAVYTALLVLLSVMDSAHVTNNPFRSITTLNHKIIIAYKPSNDFLFTADNNAIGKFIICAIMDSGSDALTTRVS